MKKDFKFVCNFKMNTVKRAEYSRAISKVNCSNLVLCPNFCDIKNFGGLTKKYGVSVGAQNVAEEVKGAWTGEVSAEMLANVGVKYCIVGHSERKLHFFEKMSQINKKAKQLLSYGITPIICVGEDIKKQTFNETVQTDFAKRYVESELQMILKGINAQMVIIAYEPIWAIGTGEQPSKNHISSVIHHIKKTSKCKTVLYGGSVKLSNCQELFSISNIDGLLIGGESLKPKNIAKMIDMANNK